MKDVWSYVKRASRYLLTAVVGSVALCSCDNAIYDYEGDCSINYRVKFKYDYNIKFADAFAQEVETVTLYLLDADNNIVWQKTESGDVLKNPDYAMVVDVEPGTYSMMAWAGTADKGSFVIPSATNATGLTCTLNRSHDAEGKAYVDKDIDRLFHGYMPPQEFIDYEGTYYYTMPLVKNTNNVRVILQHTTGTPLENDRFHFSITDNNGSMDWDNTVLPDENIIYHAWHTKTGYAEMEDPILAKDARGQVNTFSATVAELTVPRLMKGHKTRLTVTDTQNGDTVFSIPLIDYALLVKGVEREEIMKMDDQEYLDREDEYAMTFFLDEGFRWINAYIYINSWKIVLQNSDL